MKPEYREKAKLCYIDTDSFIVYIKTESIYVDIAKDVETKFDTSNLRPKKKKKKIYRINERWIRSKDNNRACCIKIKII